MLSRGLLLAGSRSGATATIGEAGGMGFGVGCYPGDPSDLTAMGLTPMPGYDDPSHANYGNYQHTNGSVMVFVPAFCYRIGNAAAPSYSRDKENALEIRDAALGEGGGWILHRAFIDGGVQKTGFFFDKYICSKDSTGKLAISVKNGDNISLCSSYVNSSSMPDCVGQIYDAITLSRARGANYSLTTAFQWSAISMLSLAHGQAATSAQFCGWYDASHVKNYPKGNNNSLKDIDESSVTWTANSGGYSSLGKTGSGTPFNKTTHNGQLCGITDVNGSQWQVVLGWGNPSAKQILLAKETVRMHDFTKDNRNNAGMFDVVNIAIPDVTNFKFGANAFYSDASGTGRAACGVLPKTNTNSGLNLFGNDYGYLNYGSDRVLYVAGHFVGGSGAGVWYRYGNLNWTLDDNRYGFRAAGYAS